MTAAAPFRGPLLRLLPRAGALAAAVLLLGALPAALPAQVSPAPDVPAFQLPRGEDGYGLYVTFPQDLETVGALGTWRRSGSLVDVGVRAGLANVDRPGDDGVALSAGLDLSNELVAAYEAFPLDVSWTSGLGGVWAPESDVAMVRVPAGLVAGRRIRVEEAVVTPYLHPRLALDFVFREDTPGPGGAGDETDLRLDLDFGIDVRVRPEWSVRAGVTLGRAVTVGAGLTF